MHERPAKPSFAKKDGSFNNFRGTAPVGNAQISRRLGLDCSTALETAVSTELASWA
jgi:hypothetical protein